MVLYEDYLKLIMNGIHRNKAEFINIIQQWDEVVFPGTETSIVARKTSSRDTENEIDREIERMEDKDNEYWAIVSVCPMYNTMNPYFVYFESYDTYCDSLW